MVAEEGLLEAWQAQTTFMSPSFAIVEELAHKRREDSNVLYIVSSGKDGLHWCNVLSAYGLNYGVDFFDLTYLKHCLSQSEKKDKLLVAYGNCQMRFDLSMVDSANNSAEPVKHPRYYLAFL